MERDDISAIIQRVPQLTAFGIGLYEGGKGLSADEKEKKLQEGQEALRNAGENCTRICDWLGPITKNKTINMQQSSYGLKHVAEKDTGYITNGEFICAAIHMGFDYKLDPPNAHFNMSESSIQEKKKE